jgi:hypothetical protein
MKYRGRPDGSSGAAHSTQSSISSRDSPDGEPSEREAVERQRRDPVDRAPSTHGVDSALRDPEAELARRPRRIDLALGPELRAAHRLLMLGRRDVGRRADVEAHRDVRAEPPLDLGHASGVKRASEPSYTERNVTPSSSSTRMVSRSEKTWYPPESVRIGHFQPEKAWIPSRSSTTCSPGRKWRWYAFPRMT